MSDCAATDDDSAVPSLEQSSEQDSGPAYVVDKQNQFREMASGDMGDGMRGLGGLDVPISNKGQAPGKNTPSVSERKRLDGSSDPTVNYEQLTGEPSGTSLMGSDAMQGRSPAVYKKDDGPLPDVEDTAAHLRLRARGGDEGDLEWYPWPKKGHEVYYPKRWKDQESDDVKNNPFEHHACHVWWWSWVVFGADRDTLNIPDEYEPALAERFGWDMELAKQQTGKFKDEYVNKTKYPEELRQKLNILTIMFYLSGGKVIKLIRPPKTILLYFFALCLTSVLIPCAWTAIVYGLIPVGDMRVCDFGEYAVWLFFTMPITSLTLEVAIFSLLFAAIDEEIPWRPMWMYLPVMMFSYLSKVLLFLPIVLTVGSFSMLMVIVLTMSFLTAWGGALLLKKPICNYSVYEGRSWAAIKKAFTDQQPMDDLKELRFRTFWKVMLVYYIAFLVYSGYLLGIKYGSADVQQILAFVMGFVEVAFRKFSQHMGQPLTRDMNFMLAGLGIYTMHATFTVFSTPNIDNVDGTTTDIAWQTYLVLMLKPLSDSFTAFFHQSELWFRFRNWVKKVALPVLACKRIDYMALGIEYDVDFEGRGTTNAHPDYRRAKCYFDILTFWGGMCGNASFVLVSWVLYVGPNEYRFPYSDDPSLSLYGHNNKPYTREDFNDACIYASVVTFVLALAAAIYERYLWRYYPTIHRTFIHILQQYIDSPHLLGLAMMLVCAILIYVTSLLLTFNRVWYVDVGDTAGVCR